MGTVARQLNLTLFIPQHSYSTRFQGSKRRILGWLLQSLTAHLQHPGRVLDGFSGSGVVSYGFASMGWKVTAVDRLWSSYATVLGFTGGGASVTKDTTEAIIEHGLAYEGGPIFSTYQDTFFFDNEMRWLEGAAEFIRSLPRSDRVCRSGRCFKALLLNALTIFSTEQISIYELEMFHEVSETKQHGTGLFLNILENSLTKQTPMHSDPEWSQPSPS